MAATPNDETKNTILESERYRRQESAHMGCGQKIGLLIFVLALLGLALWLWGVPYLKQRGVPVEDDLANYTERAKELSRETLRNVRAGAEKLPEVVSRVKASGQSAAETVSSTVKKPVEQAQATAEEHGDALQSAASQAEDTATDWYEENKEVWAD